MLDIEDHRGYERDQMSKKLRAGESAIPRTPRMLIGDETAVYHFMSRTALDGFPLGDIEKDFMLDLIRRDSTLYLVEILGFCLMGNHFHMVVKMFPECRFTDEDISRRLERFRGDGRAVGKAKYPIFVKSFSAFQNSSVKSRLDLKGLSTNVIAGKVISGATAARASSWTKERP